MKKVKQKQNSPELLSNFVFSRSGTTRALVCAVLSLYRVAVGGDGAGGIPASGHHHPGLRGSVSPRWFSEPRGGRPRVCSPKGADQMCGLSAPGGSSGETPRTGGRDPQVSSGAHRSLVPCSSVRGSLSGCPSGLWPAISCMPISYLLRPQCPIS